MANAKTTRSSIAQEGQSKRIELKELNRHLAARMLEHLYGANYPGHKRDLPDDPESSYISELHIHAQMYGLADEYDIKDLKEEALWKFKLSLQVVEEFENEQEKLLATIPLIYSTTPDSDRGLRDVVVDYGATNLEDIMDLPGLKSAANQAPIYMIEVLPKFLTKIKEKKQFKTVLQNKRRSK